MLCEEGVSSHVWPPAAASIMWVCLVYVVVDVLCAYNVENLLLLKCGNVRNRYYITVALFLSMFSELGRPWLLRSELWCQCQIC